MPLCREVHLAEACESRLWLNSLDMRELLPAAQATCRNALAAARRAQAAHAAGADIWRGQPRQDVSRCEAGFNTLLHMGRALERLAAELGRDIARGIAARRKLDPAAHAELRHALARSMFLAHRTRRAMPAHRERLQRLTQAARDAFRALPLGCMADAPTACHDGFLLHVK